MKIYLLIITGFIGLSLLAGECNGYSNQATLRINAEESVDVFYTISGIGKDDYTVDFCYTIENVVHTGLCHGFSDCYEAEITSMLSVNDNQTYPETSPSGGKNHNMKPYE